MTQTFNYLYVKIVWNWQLTDCVYACVFGALCIWQCAPVYLGANIGSHLSETARADDPVSGE